MYRLVEVKDLDGTRTSGSPGEKDHSCPFVVMQQVSEQGSAISAHGNTNILLENTITNLNTHLHCRGESGAFS